LSRRPKAQGLPTDCVEIAERVKLVVVKIFAIEAMGMPDLFTEAILNFLVLGKEV
jgi:hypothetical protein